MGNSRGGDNDNTDGLLRTEVAMANWSLVDWATIIGATPIIFGIIVWLWRRYVAPVHRIVRLIRDEVLPDSGKSMRDAINRIDTAVAEIRDHLAANAHRTRTLLRGFQTPVFETDKEGNFVWANDAYIELCGRNLDEITRSGWLTHIDQEEREEVRQEWTRSIAQLRDFDMEYTIVNHKVSRRHYVRGRASVLRGLDQKVMGYLGTAELLRPSTRDTT